MRIRLGRAALLTVVLAFTGALVGSLLGTLVLLLLSIQRLSQWNLDVLGGMWVIGTMVGSPLGLVGAPLLGWLFLRRVPLGRAICVMSLGTVAGSLAGFAVWWFGRIGGDISGLFLIGGATAGFLLTAYALWATARPLRPDPAT